MSDKVYLAIATSNCGFVEAPAGCGKTEAIARVVGGFCKGPQLILTHTHAGVDALTQRLRDLRVPSSKYHVDTIAGWSWGWVRRYPANGLYLGSNQIAIWNDVYKAMANLLRKEFVRQGILNSYAGVIVDEYQDCTTPMHQLIVDLKQLVPCRVLGDDLQGIFGFRGDNLVDWNEVKKAFPTNLGALETPYRWIKAENEPLGRWLLDARSDFRQNREPDYQGSTIDRRTISYRDLGKQLIRLTHEKKGNICVIGPKARPLPAALETMLVNNKYHILEPNELGTLLKLVLALSDGTPDEKKTSTIDFFSRVHGGLSAADKTFISKIVKAENQKPTRSDRKALCLKHDAGTTPSLISDLLEYTQKISGVSCKLKDSVSALKCILESHFESGSDLKTLYADEISKRKHQRRSSIYRCAGSTLLVKGLEFEHTVIIRDADWLKNWGSHRDLYVALTRGSKTVTLMELSG